MRPIVSSSSVSWGADTQWMQLTGHVSIASCKVWCSGQQWGRNDAASSRRIPGQLGAGAAQTLLQVHGLHRLAAAIQSSKTMQQTSGPYLQLLHAINTLVPHTAASRTQVERASRSVAPEGKRQMARYTAECRAGHTAAQPLPCGSSTQGGGGGKTAKQRRHTLSAALPRCSTGASYSKNTETN